MAILARINFGFGARKEALKISNYLDTDLVLFLDVSDQGEAIDLLIDLLDKAGKLPVKEAFRKAVFEREELISTGIGLGVAVPHAKLKAFKEFFIAVGIQQKKGIEWDAIDKAPVRFIFLIGGPEDRQSEYLQILSQLTAAIKDAQVRKDLLRATTADEVLLAFASFQ